MDDLKKQAGLVVKIAGGIVLAILLIVAVSQSFYTVKEAEAAVVTTFGKAEVKEQKGLHFKIPFIQKVQKVDTTVQGVAVGYDPDSSQTLTEGQMITSDFNFVNVEFYISYQVVDPKKYLYQTDNPDEILKDIAMSSIRATLSAYSVDSAMTTGKTEIQSNVKNMIIEELEKQDMGINLVDASLQNVDPPTEEVRQAFRNVETAKQGKETALNEANQYRNEQLPKAEAEADKIIQTAKSVKTARINEAKGQKQRFEAEYEEYKNYPLIIKKRMFLEAMEDVLPSLQVVIDDSDGNIVKVLPSAALDSLAADAGKEAETGKTTEEAKASE